MEQVRTIFQTRGQELLNKVPGYKFEGNLGEGSFGAVYKAKHIKSGKYVAIKVNKTERLTNESTSGWEARIKQELKKVDEEVESLRKVKNAPNCIEFYEYFKNSGDLRRYIVTRMYEGNVGDLYDKDLSESSLFRIFKHCTRAINFLVNQVNLAHRDIHPGNIFYHTKDGQLSFVLGDFGMTVKIGTKDGEAGCVTFRPPEMRKGGPSTRTSDIYTMFASIAWVSKKVKLSATCVDDGNHKALQSMKSTMLSGWMHCTASKPDDRPSSRRLLEQIEAWDSFRKPGEQKTKREKTGISALFGRESKQIRPKSPVAVAKGGHGFHEEVTIRLLPQTHTPRNLESKLRKIVIVPKEKSTAKPSGTTIPVPKPSRRPSAPEHRHSQAMLADAPLRRFRAPPPQAPSMQAGSQRPDYAYSETLAMPHGRAPQRRNSIAAGRPSLARGFSGATGTYNEPVMIAPRRRNALLGGRPPLPLDYRSYGHGETPALAAPARRRRNSFFGDPATAGGYTDRHGPCLGDSDDEYDPVLIEPSRRGGRPCYESFAPESASGHGCYGDGCYGDAGASSLRGQTAAARRARRRSSGAYHDHPMARMFG